MFGSPENKLKITLMIILSASTIVLLIYFKSLLDNNFERESEQLLYSIGKNYKYEIQTEFSKFSAISDLLAKTVAKRNPEKGFDNEITDIFRDLLYKNSRLQSIELILNLREPDKGLNSEKPESELENSNAIRLYKSKNGITEDNTQRLFYSENMRISVEKAKMSDQTVILAPENIQNEGVNSTVVPIVSSIYNGKHFLGYILLSVSVNWNSQPDYNQVLEFTEIFVTSEKGIALALNKNQDLTAEPIEKVCQSCGELLGNKGEDYNSGIEDGYITICSPWQVYSDSDYWNICVRVSEKNISAYLGYNFLYALIIAAIITVLAMIMIIFVLRKYGKTWEAFEIYALAILRGEEALPYKASKLIGKGRPGELKSALVKIKNAFDSLATFNEGAINGNFDYEVENEFKNHPAYKSAKSSHFHFKSSIEKLEKENEAFRQKQEITDGLEKIEAVLKQHHNDLQQLSVQIVRTLVDLLEIEMGAMFLAKSENEKPYLDLEVSYAYSENRFQKRRFNFGESLVGACASEKRTIYLKKVPEDYLKIISGLGLASPKSILIVPLIFENKILGVMELGSLNDFAERKITFTEKAAETIANTMSMAEINIKTSALLEQTKSQTIELEKRDKQMLEAIEELKQLQNKTALSESSIRAKLEAMNNTLMMVEYTSRGILLDANYKYLNTMNFAREDIIGIDVLELLKESERAELIKIINTVKNGNFYEGIIRRHTRQGDEKWLMATYTPVFSDKNVVESILFFATDVTRMRKNETALKEKILELNQQVEALRAMLKGDKN